MEEIINQSWTVVNVNMKVIARVTRESGVGATFIFPHKPDLIYKVINVDKKSKVYVVDVV